MKKHYERSLPICFVRMSGIYNYTVRFDFNSNVIS